MLQKRTLSQEFSQRFYLTKNTQHRGYIAKQISAENFCRTPLNGSSCSMNIFLGSYRFVRTSFQTFLFRCFAWSFLNFFLKDSLKNWNNALPFLASSLFSNSLFFTSFLKNHVMTCNSFQNCILQILTKCI